ncbi:MAG: hypothetical protein WCO78_01685 [Candidatus Roizmanbacteria bacterium]
MLDDRGAIKRELTEKEKIVQEVIITIESAIVRAMNGPNGEIFQGGSEDFFNGLLTAYRIVEKYDPNPPLKGDEIIEEFRKTFEKV